MGVRSQVLRKRESPLYWGVFEQWGWGRGDRSGIGRPIGSRGGAATSRDSGGCYSYIIRNPDISHFPGVRGFTGTEMYSVDRWWGCPQFYRPYFGREERTSNRGVQGIHISSGRRWSYGMYQVDSQVEHHIGELQPHRWFLCSGCARYQCGIGGLVVVFNS